MRLIVLAACFSASWALSWPQSCTLVTGDELEFFCQHVGGANVSFNARTNEYVNIHCMGTNFTCADLPVLNLANDLPLPSLMIKGCPPSILPCINEVLKTPSVSFLTVIDGAAPLEGEHVAGLGDVQSIMITRGPEKSIPSSVIEALPSLRRLRISGTALTLQPRAFVNATHIEFLELSNGVTGNIPEDAFTGLANLQILNMWGNNIKEIGVNSLRGLDSLQKISLMSSHVSHIAAGALAHAPRLQSLYLFRNQLEELPPGLLSNLTELENITITQSSFDPPLKLYRHSLENLPSLKNLIITDCSADLPEDLFTGCDELRTLTLSGNKITSLPVHIFKGMTKLESLDLNRNKIAKLESGVFAPLKKLKYLNMNRNYLEYLPEFLFAGLGNLNYVSMDHNLLTKISSQAFSGAKGLKTVSLKYNKLTLKSQEILTDGYQNFQESPFNLLDQLQNLYLNGNQISTMFNDWRSVLLQLKNLDLSDNSFSVLDGRDCEFLSSSLVVDLTRNNISELMLDHAPLTAGDPMYKESTNSILLDGNPFNCDCGLYHLAMRLKGFKTMHTEANFVVDNVKCASPNQLHGRLFKDISPNDLNCDLAVDKCDSKCVSCEIRPAFSDLAFDCLSFPVDLTDPQEFGLKKVSLKLKTPPLSISGLNLNVLNISNIGLEEIPFSPSRTVETIDFSNNILTEIPMQFLEANISLYLSNNNFICDCWHSEELSKLKSSGNVLDLSLIKCGDKLLTEMDPLQLCNSWRAAAVASATFIALVFIVAILASIMYKHSHEILVFIINRGLCPCCFVDDPDDIDKEYDVFVSYAHKDRQYLEKLMPKLETEFGLKTCVHYRDWFVGDFIPDQINRSVEKSRKTIILLSKSFLDSAYANMEFRAAHNLALKEGKSRIILILLEDVTKHDKLSEELKAHMKMNTFLKWDDARFSERLQRAVPLRNNKKFVWPEAIKQAGEKTVKSGLDVHLNSDGQLVNVAMKDAV